MFQSARSDTNLVREKWDAMLGRLKVLITLSVCSGLAAFGFAQEADKRDQSASRPAPQTRVFGVRPAPDRPADEGAGPYDRLVIRGASLIAGTGAPPQSPVDIVIKNNIITEIVSVGYPGLPIPIENRPPPADHEIDASGHYVLPGFVDTHGHISSPAQRPFGEPSPAEYVYKLWLAHGVTTVREPGSFSGVDWTLNEAERSAQNAITAPRIMPYAFVPGARLEAQADKGRAWVREMHAKGVKGFKYISASPAVFQATLDEAKTLGLKSTAHHAQLAVYRANVLDTSSWGLDSMEHWYGLPEALFEDRRIQHYPADYDYNNEQNRFGEAGRLWLQAAQPGSERWEIVMSTLLARDFSLSPTFGIYEASRDLQRSLTEPWQDTYAWPTLTRFFQPSRAAHGSYFFDWTTTDEIAWKRNYERWMRFVNEYKNRGGRVTAGSDSGFIFKVYGFGYIRELELLQEAGFHPLEVIQAATLSGAELLGLDDQIGSIEIGKTADLIIVSENPLHNLKTLYGIGAPRLNDQTGAFERVGGVKTVIKDGVVFDPQALLADVAAMVAASKAR
ncbi:MAG: amidohydrolase family protein [Maricaulaceae bacterium]